MFRFALTTMRSMNTSFLLTAVHRFCVPLTLAILGGFFVGEIRASTHTWTGGAGGVWSSAGNWSGGVPTTGESGGTIVQFNTGSSSTMDIAGLVLNEIHFTGTGNTLTIANGKSLGLSGALATNNILDDVGGNAINGPGSLDLQGAVEIFVKVTTGNTTLSCAISGGANIRIIGSGSTGVELTGNNTYTGTTKVGSGTLLLNSAGVNTAIVGPLIVGLGTATPATLKLAQSAEIADTVSVTVNSDGTFDVAGFSETIGGLTVLGGTVSKGATGTLVVGSLAMTGGSITGGAGTLSLGGDVTVTGSATSTATISVPVSLNGDRTFTVNPVVGGMVPELNVTGIISDGSAASGLTKEGTGTFRTSSTQNNYTGTTLVKKGVLEFNCSSSTAFKGHLVIGNNTDAAGSAVVKNLVSLNVPSFSDVTINASGVFNLNGFTDRAHNLTIIDGSVTLGVATLTVFGGQINMTGGSISGLGGMSVSGTPDITATSSSITGDAKFAFTGTLSLTNSTTFTINPGPSQPELTVSGNMTCSTTVTKNGDGSMQLNGSTNIFGGTHVDRGTLLLNRNGSTITRDLAIGNAVDAPGSATVRALTNSTLASTIAVTVDSSGVLDMNGFSTSVDAITGAGSVSLPSGSVLSVGSNNASFGFAGSVTGDGTFEKLGTGTMTFTGSSNVGKLQVSDGGLNLNAGTAVSVSTLLQVGNGSGAAGSATLTLVQPYPISGNPGLSVLADGVLNLNGIFQSFATTTINAGTVTLGTGSLAATGLTCSGASTLNFTTTGLGAQNTYLLVGYTSRSGNFSNFNVTGSLVGYSFQSDVVDGTALQRIVYAKSGLATTGAATNVLVTSATLNGTINPGGKVSSGFFQYGTSTVYENQTTPVKNLTGGASLPIATNITGLNGGTTYHFQIVSMNSDGFAYGADQTFTTLGASASNTAPSGISALSADVNGMVNPHNTATSVVFEYGLTSALGMKTAPIQLPAGNANVAVTKHLTGLLPLRTYFYRIVATNSLGVTRTAISTFTTLVVLPPKFSPGGTPASVMAFAGAFVGFSVVATESSPVPTDAPLTYQWFKNGAAISGATLSTYSLTASLTNAAAYTCTVKNLAGSITTPPAQLGVVEASALKPASKAVGASHTMTVNAAGNYLAYAWKKDGVAVANNTAKSLTLTNLQPSNSGDYTCVVTNLGGSVTFGTTRLSVFTEKPIILTPVNPTHGIVGGSYSFQIPYDQNPNRAPTSVIVKGLPAGLKADAFGLITGRITASQTAVQNYPLTITASNTSGSTADVPATLTVDPFPTGSLGVYNGTVSRHSVDNPYGGSINVTISGIGAYTGKIVIAGVSYPISGNFNASFGSSVLTASIVIKRPTSFDLTFTLLADTTGNSINGTVTKPGNIQIATVSAKRNPFSTSVPFPRTGTFTSEFFIQDGALVGNDLYPQGRGYATVVVNANGTINCTAKMADGNGPTPATLSTTIDNTGEFLLHFMLNANTASVQGFADITTDLGVPVNGGQPLLSGAVDWFKAAQPIASTTRVYKNGIPLHNLTWLGGKYTAPAANTPVLGLTPSGTPGVNNARFAISQGGLTAGDTTPLSRQLRITPTNTADFSNPADGNPMKLALSINAAAGSFNGSFTASGNRNVTFSGLLIPRTDIRAGAAFFLMPGTVPSTTTSPMLSGELLLLPP